MMLYPLKLHLGQAPGLGLPRGPPSDKKQRLHETSKDTSINIPLSNFLVNERNPFHKINTNATDIHLKYQAVTVISWSAHIYALNNIYIPLDITSHITIHKYHF